ncbi:DUF4390 domain-containing protein, partial [Brachyspira hampsonii]|nr:DUF4390 domain-containing protein [Brachyspira hampsonii]
MKRIFILLLFFIIISKISYSYE